jgi:hypothetical protein
MTLEAERIDQPIEERLIPGSRVLPRPVGGAP